MTPDRYTGDMAPVAPDRYTGDMAPVAPDRASQADVVKAVTQGRSEMDASSSSNAAAPSIGAQAMDATLGRDRGAGSPGLRAC